MNSDIGQRDQWEKLYSGNPVQWRGDQDISWCPLEKGNCVLDLGCGNGKTSHQLSLAGYSVVGIDFQESAINECKSRIPEGKFVLGDFRSLPFQDESFDQVLAIHQLEHVSEEDLIPTVKEAFRVLSHGGKMIIQQFGTGDFRQENKTESVRNGILYRYFTEQNFQSLLIGWNIVSLETIRKKTKFEMIRETIRCVALKP